MLSEICKEKLQQISRLISCPLFYFKDKILIWSTHSDHPFRQDTAIMNALETPSADTRFQLIQNDSPIFYLEVFFECAEVCVAGPFCSSMLSLAELHQYGKNNHCKIPAGYLFCRLTGAQIYSLLHLIQDTVSGNWIRFSENHISFNSVKITDDFIPTLSTDIQRYRLTNSEHDVNHIPYYFQKEVFRCIKEADYQGFLALGDQLVGFSVGKIAYSGKKQTEYAVCAAITICTTAAIEGGMDQYMAYDLHDTFLQKLSLCKTENEMNHLLGQVYYEYLGGVSKAKNTKKHSAYIEDAKNYISRNLTKPLTVDIIARNIGISKSYLLHLFKENEETTLMEYLYQERIYAAKNMLRYSDYTISSISDYLCFSSPSHFGRVFKKAAGVTPLRYRQMKKNKK